MMRKVYSLIMLFVLQIILITGCSNSNVEKVQKPKNLKSVVVTNFVAYDFVRAVAGDTVDLKFLLDPGIDAHSYDPTPADIISIQKSDVFFYIGGEMESWVDELEGSGQLDNVIRYSLMETVDLVEETPVDYAEDNHAHDDDEHDDEEDEHDDEEDEHDAVVYDEHIWTSPSNAIKMVDGVLSILCEIIPENVDLYTANADEYKDGISVVRSKLQEIVDNKVRDRLVFGDKMPMQYFLNEFNLQAAAAFSGCSTETEPSISTITGLTDFVKENNIPVVLYIEMNTGKVANAIANEVGAKSMQIQTLHNISKDDFIKGETYVTLMTRNLDVIKEALQ